MSDKTNQMQRLWDKAIPIKTPCLSDSYVFKFGKYSGMTAKKVKEDDEQYIVWFEVNVPIEKW